MRKMSDDREEMTGTVKLSSGDNSSIEINKTVFLKYSGYYRGLVNSRMMDSTKSELHFENLSADNLSEVKIYFEWLNGGAECFPIQNSLKNHDFEECIDIPLYRVEDGLQPAYYLQIENMISIYTTKLSNSLSLFNWYPASIIIQKYCINSIENKLLNFIIRHFNKVAESSYYHLMPPKYMKQILISDCLLVKSEFNLFEHLLVWLRKNEDCQWMLQLIRYELIDATNLKQCEMKLRRSRQNFVKVLIHSLTSLNPSIHHFLKEETLLGAVINKLIPKKNLKNSFFNYYPLLNTLNYHPLSQPTPNHHPPSPKPSLNIRLRNKASFLVSLGGFSEPGVCTKTSTGIKIPSSIGTKNVQLMKAANMKKMVQYALKGGRVTGRNSRISRLSEIRYILDQPSKAIKTSNGFKDYIKFIPSHNHCLPSKLCEHQVVVLNGLLYVVGGQTRYKEDGSATTNAVHHFNPLTLKWHQCAKMNTTRSLFYLAVLNNKLYAVAGSTSRNMDTSTVEWYDPFEDRWSMLNSFPTNIHEHAGCIHEDTIFISGGFRGMKLGHTDQVWKYDIGSDAWKKMPSLCTPRSLHCMVSWRESMFVVGGVRYPTDNIPLDIMDGEMYTRGQWMKLIKLQSPASCFSHLLLLNNHNNNENNNSINNDNNNDDNNNINNNDNNNKRNMNGKRVYDDDGDDDDVGDKLLIFGGHSFEQDNNSFILQVIDLSAYHFDGGGRGGGDDCGGGRGGGGNDGGGDNGGGGDDDGGGGGGDCFPIYYSYFKTASDVFSFETALISLPADL